MLSQEQIHPEFTAIYFRHELYELSRNIHLQLPVEVDAVCKRTFFSFHRIQFLVCKLFTISFLHCTRCRRCLRAKTFKAINNELLLLLSCCCCSFLRQLFSTLASQPYISVNFSRNSIFFFERGLIFYKQFDPIIRV